jgi:hypothetical protein
MAGVLNFAQYLGGPDNVQCEQTFPSSQQTLQYNFGVSLNGWTFDIESQTIVVDQVTFDRLSGQPNFANSKVIGYFPKVTIDTYTNVNYINVTGGLVNITIPGNLYAGPILPDARQNVPINVISVQWTDAGTPPQINSHRWAFIQCWEPGVPPGDPNILNTTATGYTAII